MQATIVAAGPAAVEDHAPVQAVLQAARAEQRTSLTALEAERVCDAYGIPVAQEGLATSAEHLLRSGQQVRVGAIIDPTFGPVMTLGLGGVPVERSRDVTFRLAPTSVDEALTMVDGSRAARGGPPAGRSALADLIARVSRLVTDFPEITEVNLEPVLATEDGATALDARFAVSFEPAGERPARYSEREILATMNRLLRPRAIAVIGASDQQDEIGNSIMRNLVDGGFGGAIYPVNPRGGKIHGRQAYRDVAALPDGVDVAVFAIPAEFVVDTLAAVGDKGISTAILIPSGFAETGEVELQRQLVQTAREHGVRFLGPNVYGVYYTPQNMSATLTTPYDLKGQVALASASGGIAMGILGFSRSNQLGVSAIVGLGNKADIDEDDLLTFFEHDENTSCVALHMDDLQDGRAFVEVAQRVSRKKPIVVLKAGDDKLYDDILRQAGVVRARGLGELLQLARCLPLLPTPKGENVVIITGAGASGALLSHACSSNGLNLMEMPDDLRKEFMLYIPPFGAAGNPVDVTGREPPQTYRDTIELAFDDDRVHALVLGYRHTIITPPRTFAGLVTDIVEEYRERGIEKPVVASLAGDVEVEQASQYLFDHGIPAFPYTTETPVEVLAAKYRWARLAGVIDDS
jgi:acyl-CoA synthetase (NDP forming)